MNSLSHAPQRFVPDLAVAAMVAARLERSATHGPSLSGIDASSEPPTPWGRRLEDREFSTMVRAFQRTGGLLRDVAMARRLRRHHQRPWSLLDRWIGTREVISVTYEGQRFVPLFQFETSSLTPAPDLMPVLKELHSAFDDWEIAAWFACPNMWLDEFAPVDVFADCPSSVIDAARADRWIAMG